VSVRNRWPVGWLLLLAFVLLGAVAQRSQAAPPFDQTKPDKGYAKIEIRGPVLSVDPKFGAICTYQFLVSNPVDRQAERGIKGLLIYGGPRPVIQNDRPEANEWIWQTSHPYSRWEIKGPPHNLVNEPR